MSDIRVNDSYSRCLSELRARYKGRGVANNMGNKTMAEGAREISEPESYVLFDSRSNIADSYRSGVYNGSKYMTSDDFVRYFKSRRAFYMPEALRMKQEEAMPKAVVQKQHNVASRRRRESTSSGRIQRRVTYQG